MRIAKTSDMSMCTLGGALSGGYAGSRQALERRRCATSPLHSGDLLSDGVPLRKVFAVTTWRESSFFTSRERLALELTEAITDIAGGVCDDLWDRVGAAFSDKEVGDLVLAISMINVWNRIQPEPIEETAAVSG
jgi:alkylhydroperoxidase family enzyme